LMLVDQNICYFESTKSLLYVTFIMLNVAKNYKVY